MFTLQTILWTGQCGQLQPQTISYDTNYTLFHVSFWQLSSILDLSSCAFSVSKVMMCFQNLLFSALQGEGPELFPIYYVESILRKWRLSKPGTPIFYCYGVLRLLCHCFSQTSLLFPQWCNQYKRCSVNRYSGERNSYLIMKLGMYLESLRTWYLVCSWVCCFLSARSCENSRDEDADR